MSPAELALGDAMIPAYASLSEADAYLAGETGRRRR